MPARAPRSLPLAAALALAALLGACSPTVSPSPSPTASPAPSATPTGTPRAAPSDSGSSAGPTGSLAPGDETTYHLIEEAVAPLRELEPVDDVDPQLLNEEELKERTERSFTEDNPAELIEANEVLYRALDMLEEDASLADLYVELLGSQVAGFYDPEVDELFVVSRSGGLGVTERITYAHEYTHALQDQHFDLESFGLDEIGEGDRNTARLTLIEGDATAVMSFWARDALTPEEMVDLFGASLDPEAQEILNRMPPILRESLMFPYETGLRFVLGLQTAGGWDAVNDAYEDPPASTEQVMHPEKYDTREAPKDVKLPADLAGRMGEGWAATYEDTFGELQTQIWLRNAIDAETGNAAAAGWGGDRFAVLQGPDDAWSVVMATDWDTQDDAREFRNAAGTVVADGEHPGTVISDGTEHWVIVASDGATLNAAVAAAGFDLP
jgi:hypothetical protein